METHYTRSTGERRLIADMAFPHLDSAVKTIERDGMTEARAPEVEAMRARMAELEADYQAGAAKYLEYNPTTSVPFDVLPSAEKRDWIAIAKAAA